MQLFYADTYEIPLPERHRFPRNKNRLTREALLREELIEAERLTLSPLADATTSSVSTRPITRMAFSAARYRPR
ncbi:MAG: hypothetical protein HC774_08305 [Sphingomonadales bacterium]|nr:hypothetical protein [Sphingomonadales bacterium]